MFCCGFLRQGPLKSTLRPAHQARDGGVRGGGRGEGERVGAFHTPTRRVAGLSDGLAAQQVARACLLLDMWLAPLDPGLGERSSGGHALQRLCAPRTRVTMHQGVNVRCGSGI